jgi:hypothetical protein
VRTGASLGFSAGLAERLGKKPWGNVFADEGLPTGCVKSVSGFLKLANKS